MSIAGLVVTLILSSNAAGKTLVRQQQGTVVPAPLGSKALVREDAAAVCHPRWNGTAISDSRCSWTMQGTVPQIAKSPPRPAGSGPYTVANYYTLGTGTDALDFAGDFTFVVIFVPPSSLTGYPVLFQDLTANTAGYDFHIDPAGKAVYQAYNPAQVVASPANAVVASKVNVVCGGISGNTITVILNNGTPQTGTQTTKVPGTSATASLGWGSVGAAMTTGGVIYEAYFTSTGATSAGCTAYFTAISAALGGSTVVAW